MKKEIKILLLIIVIFLIVILIGTWQNKVDTQNQNETIIISNELKNENINIKDMQKDNDELNENDKQNEEVEESLKYFDGKVYYENIEVPEEKIKLVVTTEDKKASYILLIENISGEDEDIAIYQSKDASNIWSKMSTQKMKTYSIINLSARNNMACDEGQNDVWYYTNSENEYYGTKDGGKTFTKILSYKEAFEIASEEVKKDEYIEKSFSGEGFSNELLEDYYVKQGKTLERDLIVLKENTKLQYLGGSINKIMNKDKINGQLVWGMHFGDNGDPLTSINIFVDAITGEIVGSGVYGD